MDGIRRGEIPSISHFIGDIYKEKYGNWVLYESYKNIKKIERIKWSTELKLQMVSL
ncbi:hypothetical protein HNV12_12215 [Methanococcoides sp. SA1]|nr:hypothetical protein [Methanococcoides sp. SA1]